MVVLLKYGVAFGLGVVLAGSATYWLQKVHYERLLDLTYAIEDSATLARDARIFSSDETEIPCIAAILARGWAETVEIYSQRRMPAPIFEAPGLPAFAQEAAVEALEDYRNTGLPERFVACRTKQRPRD